MLVVDASFAVEAVMDAELRKALYAELEKGEDVVVPHMYQAEVANALWKYVRAGLLTVDDAVARMEESFGFVGQLVSMDSLLPEALTEAARLKHAVCDMFYFVLARRYKATLCTLDRKLQAICIRNGVSMVALADGEWGEMQQKGDNGR